jgi:hypothetical protein
MPILDGMLLHTPAISDFVSSCVVVLFEVAESVQLLSIATLLPLTVGKK